MSATLSGPIVLDNPKAVDGSPRSIEFDGQMWLGAGNILTGRFRYFNGMDHPFDPIGHYFAWIHVPIYNSLVRILRSQCIQIARIVPTADDGDADQEELSDGSGTVTLGDDFNIYGDIVHVRSVFIPVAKTATLTFFLS